MCTIYIAEITNDPSNTTVCNGGTVNISCGFTSSDPGGVIIMWKIITTSDDGNVIERNVRGSMLNGGSLQWILDGNNPENSYLKVVQVNETYNQSSFQCTIERNDGNIVSETATLTVVGECIMQRNSKTVLLQYWVSRRCLLANKLMKHLFCM